MKKRIEPELKQAIEDNRLLVVSPFEESVKYVTRETAMRRNKVMADLADEIFIAYAQKGGNLEKLIPEFIGMGKRVYTFGVDGNKILINDNITIHQNRI